ncbi:MAG: hypothetical protein IPJ25_14805 [Rhodocyclaceae bacterium]|nr:hypothetical protein [Rhodocyclaceae bacterium]
MRLIRIVTALCLVMLLLNGQHGAFAHALEHLPPSVGLHQGDDITAPQATPDDDSVCLTCVAYAAIGAGVRSDPLLACEAPIHVCLASLYFQSYSGRQSHNLHRARAPPAFS